MTFTTKKTILNDASVVADTTSLEISIVDTLDLTFHLVTTGSSISATYQVQVSNDPDPNTTNWANEGSAVALTAAGQSTIIKVTPCVNLKARLFIDYTSGTLSTLKCFAVAKG